MLNTNMWLDGDASNQPPDTCRENYNINNYNEVGGITNELNNGIFSSYTGNCIGVIPLNDNSFCIFSRDNRIGLLDSNGIYKDKVNYTFLNFDDNTEIQGDYYINDKDERVVLFTYNNGLKKVNLDNVYIEDIDLINKAIEPNITSNIITGGNLEIGGYIVICRYVREDLSTTNYFKSYKPITIQKGGKKSGEVSNNSISLTISNLDTTYKYLEIGYVRSKETIKEAFITNKIRIAGNTTTVIISGGEISVPVNLTEIIENKAVYSGINYIKFVKNTLMGLGVKEFKELNHQKLVNNIKLNWLSYLPILDININLNTVEAADISKLPTFAHGEVYAFYIRFKYYWGKGNWYVLKGREANLTEKDNVNINNKTYKKYQVEDTTSLIEQSSSGNLGTFGFWENQNENYPLEGDFPVGNVKHFKFPSINWMRNNLYTTDLYGTTYIDVLGVKPSEINLSDFIDSKGNIPYDYEIGYASRNAFNSTVLGQSIVVVNQFTNSNGNNFNQYTQDKRYSNGGNFVTDTVIYEDRKNHRVYPLEALVNLGTTKISSIREELQIKKSTSSFIITNTINNPLDNNFKYYHLQTDYTSGQSSTLPSNYKNTVKDSFIVLNNTIKNNIDNSFSETFLNIEYTENSDSLTNLLDSTVISHGKLQNTPLNGKFETTKLITLLNDTVDCYIGFNNQKINTLNIKDYFNKVFYGGDTYINKLNVVLYATYADAYRKAVETSDKDDEQGLKEGNVCIKTYLCESVYNANNLIDYDVKHFPNFDFTNTSLYHVNRSRDLDPNYFNTSINKDYSIKNDLDYSKVFLKDNVDYEDNEFKIIRSGNYNNSKFFNIREFSRDDYYLINKSKGKPIAIIEERDFIYIQTTVALYKSITSERAAVDSTDNLLYVKVGDIFDHPLVEVQHTDLGEIGSKHRHSCKLTKWGYVTVDADKRKVFLISNGIKVLSDEGLINTFRELLTENLNSNPFKEKSVWCEVDELFERLFLNIGDTTLVYSFASKGWTNFITYNPKYMFRSRTNLYSLYNNVIYNHNLDTGYNNLYGKNISSSIKKVFSTRDKSNQLFPLNGLKFKTSLLHLLRFYNSYQDSGYLNLKPINPELPIEENSGNVRKFKSDWLFYLIRDYKTTDKLIDSYVVVEAVLTDLHKQVLTEIELTV
jgi:hypothetical protein